MFWQSCIDVLAKLDVCFGYYIRTCFHTPPSEHNKPRVICLEYALTSAKSRGYIIITLSEWDGKNGQRLNQRHSIVSTFLAHCTWPDTCLDFTDVSFMQQNHAKTALTNATANTQRELTIKKALMEIKFLAFFLARQFELTVQCFRIDAYTHRTKFHSTPKHWVPNHYITVEAKEPVTVRSCPVIIVRSTEVMRLAIAEFTTYAHDEDRSVSTANLVFAFFRSEVWIEPKQFLGMDEMNLLWEKSLNLREVLTNQVFCTAQCIINLTHDVLQELYVPI